MNKMLNISIVRVMACIMVVFYHCICPYTPMWHAEEPLPMYTFIGRILHAIDMPCFFLISGYLYGLSYLQYNKYENSLLFVKSKTLRLFLPYLFWGVFLCLVMPDKYRFMRILTGISHLWFLLSLFCMFLLTRIKLRFWIQLSCRNLCIITMICFVLHILVGKLQIPNWLGVYSTLQYFPVFVAGIWIGTHQLPRFHIYKLLFLLILIIAGIYTGRGIIMTYCMIFGGGWPRYCLDDYKMSALSIHGYCL